MALICGHFFELRKPTTETTEANRLKFNLFGSTATMFYSHIKRGQIS